uniref:netrin-5 isoform X2 n=1 Tax=Nyctereutes procyonoides TaxID=34880 RepID=UPI002443DD17|nr:netrin-5 isoform X2 [Nyctereutes procyonoides]
MDQGLQHHMALTPESPRCRPAAKLLREGRTHEELAAEDPLFLGTGTPGDSRPGCPGAMGQKMVPHELPRQGRQGACSAGTMPVIFALWLLLSQATADPCYHPGGRPRFCLPPVTQLAGTAASCPQACALSLGADLSPRATCNGSLTLALGGPFLLTSVSLRFCTPGSPALVLSAAWASGGPWRSLWRRPAWPGALGGPEKVTFRAPPGPKSSVVVSHLRVEFGGRAGLAAAGVRGRCQCHGHAARCAARARPPRCRCRHHTTGPGCESCRPSHRDWPWRPATPWHPHPCLRIPEATTPLVTTPGAYSSDPQCQNYCNVSDTRVHMSLRRYCQQDYVLRAQVLASEAAGQAWQRLAVRVLAVYKQRARPVRHGSQDAWVPRADLACGCLRLQPDTDYLLLGSAAGGPDPARLVLDRHGLALPWRPRWARPLRRLQLEERAGGCRGLRPPAPSPDPSTTAGPGRTAPPREEQTPACAEPSSSTTARP